jgi:GNAT superfamily N-acetyltransferase
MSDLNINFEYRITSCLGPLYSARYNKQIFMDIFAADEYGNNDKLIGKVKFYIIYVGNAINDTCDLYHVFDEYEYTFRHCQTIFNFETYELNEDIEEYYDHDLWQSDICILERIEILPEYRGHKIGAKAIKDIIFHFGSGCCLFVGEAYPLQFESEDKEMDEWRRDMELDKFDSDEKKSFSNLKNYYLSIGFEEIPNYKNLLFINPSKVNEKLDSIDLEE